MNIKDKTKMLLIIASSILIINSCVTHSSAILLYKGEVDLVLDENCTMTGRILDKNTKKPIAGAYVIIKGTSMGASADNYGNYSIGKIPPGKYDLTVGTLSFETLELIDFNFEKSHYYLMDFELIYDPPIFQY